jgi:hypothetical protein
VVSPQKLGSIADALELGKPVFSRTFLGRSGSHILLAMQKVEGSNPFSRFRKGPDLQDFSVAAVALFVCIRSD